MHDGPEGVSCIFFWIAAIAGNECKKGLTQECVDVNAAGELIGERGGWPLGRLFIFRGIKYLCGIDMCDL